MNPDGFPNPINPDGTPMFPGGPRPLPPSYAAAWQNFCLNQGLDPNYGDEVYRPGMVGTPGSGESNIDPNTEFDPHFNTDSYELSDMEPNSSPEETPAPQPRKKGKAKGKAKAAETSTPAPKDDNKRQNYTSEESMILARCWIDISEDPIYSNNQRVIKYWGRIADRYNSLRPAGSKKRTGEQLRKHWDRTKREIAKFSADYLNTLRMWGSGESMDDIRDKAMKAYSQNGLYPEFKHYDIWLIVKDLPKFQGGVVPASGPKRTKLTVSGDYSSSGGGDAVDLNAVDLNEPMVASSGTPVSTDMHRPSGIKAAKRKGKAQATTSEPAVDAPTPQDPQLTALMRIAAQRALLDAHNALIVSQSPSQREYLEGLIEQLKGQLGLK